MLIFLTKRVPVNLIVTPGAPRESELANTVHAPHIMQYLVVIIYFIILALEQSIYLL